MRDRVEELDKELDVLKDRIERKELSETKALWETLDKLAKTLHMVSSFLKDEVDTLKKRLDSLEKRR